MVRQGAGGAKGHKRAQGLRMDIAYEIDEDDARLWDTMVKQNLHSFNR